MAIGIIIKLIVMILNISHLNHMYVHVQLHLASPWLQLHVVKMVVLLKQQWEPLTELFKHLKQDKEGKKGEAVETSLGNVVKDKTSQTYLSVVLNAWFSARFYTGKYLSEQASGKK